MSAAMSHHVNEAFNVLKQWRLRLSRHASLTKFTFGGEKNKTTKKTLDCGRRLLAGWHKAKVNISSGKEQTTNACFLDWICRWLYFRWIHLQEWSRNHPAIHFLNQYHHTPKKARTKSQKREKKIEMYNNNGVSNTLELYIDLQEWSQIMLTFFFLNKNEVLKLQV